MTKPSHTPLRNVRVDAQTWEQAKAVAEARGETISDVIRAALVQYVRRHAGRPQTPGGTASPDNPNK